MPSQVADDIVIEELKKDNIYWEKAENLGNESHAKTQCNVLESKSTRYELILFFGKKLISTQQN